MALIASIWEASNMTVRLGSVSSNLVRFKRAPESPVICTPIMAMVLRTLATGCRAIDLCWKLNDFSLAAICHADDVALVAQTMGAADTMVSETIEELGSIGQTVGVDKTHWKSFHGRLLSASGRRAGNVGRCLELCWIHDELGWKCEFRYRVLHGPGKHMLWKMEVCAEFAVGPNLDTCEVSARRGVANLLVEVEHIDDSGRTERDNIASCSAQWNRQ